MRYSSLLLFFNIFHYQVDHYLAILNFNILNELCKWKGKHLPASGTTSSDSIFPDYFGREGANSRVGLKSPILTYARLELVLSGNENQLYQIILNKNVLSDVKCAK